MIQRTISVKQPTQIKSAMPNTNPISAPNADENSKYAFNAFTIGAICFWVLAAFVYITMMPQARPQDTIFYHAAIGALIITPGVIGLCYLSAGQRVHLNAVESAFDNRYIEHELTDIRSGMSYMQGAIQSLLPAPDSESNDRQTAGSMWQHKVADLEKPQLREVAKRVLRWNGNRLEQTGATISRELLQNAGVRMMTSRVEEMWDEMGTSDAPTGYNVLCYLWKLKGWMTTDNFPGPAFIRFIEINPDLHPPYLSHDSSSRSSDGRRRHDEQNVGAHSLVGEDDQNSDHRQFRWHTSNGLLAGTPTDDDQIEYQIN